MQRSTHGKFGMPHCNTYLRLPAAVLLMGPEVLLHKQCWRVAQENAELVSENVKLVPENARLDDDIARGRDLRRLREA